MQRSTASCAGQVEDLIGKFAKKGATPSQIGVMLRDSHGVPQVNGITGSKVLRILKKNGAHNRMEQLHNSVWPAQSTLLLPI